MRRTALTVVTTAATLVVTATAAAALSLSRDSAFAGGDGIATLDVTGNEFAFDVVTDDDGYYLIGGTRKNRDAACSFLVARYTNAGRLDATWGNEGIRTLRLGRASCATSATLRPGGGLLVAGWSTVNSGSASVVALRPNGSFDRSFSVDGMQHLSERQGVANPQIQVEPDGSIWLAWSQIRNWDTYAGNYRVAHLRASGAIDRTFGNRGIRSFDLKTVDYLYTSTVDSSGRLYLAGHSSRSERSTARAGLVSVDDGERAHVRTWNSWPSDGTQVISADVDTSDHLILGLTPAERAGWGAARLNSDLTLDRTYGNDGVARHRCDCFTNTGTLTADGLVLVGSTRTRSDRTVVARFDTDGAWDAQAALSGPWAFSDRWEIWNEADIDALGRVVLAGSVGSRGGDAAIARLTIS
jgi:uncharacterized delta-60 repeat protein